MSEHSLNSPSSFARRIGCPGSANMEKQIPSKGSSPYAAEGTAAHALGELCLLQGTDPSQQKGEIIKNDDGTEFEVCPDMIDAVQVYVNHCRSVMTPNKESSLVEYKFPLPFLGPNEKGTSDFTSIHEGVLHVIDYKHGKGVPVDAKGNIQGLCYGLGAAKHFEDCEWDTLRITIVQPRAYHEDDGIRSWDVPRGELVDYMIDFAYHAKATESPDAPLSVGTWCRFCNAKPVCPQHMKNAEKVMEMDFTDPSSKPVPIDFLTDEQIADIVLNKVKIIKDWCASIEDYAQYQAETGKPLPGTKLVHTRAKRMWKDKEQAEKVFSDILGNEAYKIERDFKTAPQIEKVLGKKKFAEYNDMVDKVSTGVTLVPESDKRASVRPSAESEFSTHS